MRYENSIFHHFTFSLPNHLFQTADETVTWAKTSFIRVVHTKNGLESKELALLVPFPDGCVGLF